MTRLLKLHNSVFAQTETLLSGWFLATFARITFAAVLLRYFWNSAWLKVDDGWLHIFPDDGAYIQILPQRVEAVGYDFSQLNIFDTLIVTVGTWAEFVLPALILFGLFTRLAAIGMIGFITVQSVVDVTGHGADATTIGAWFDLAPGSLILDQRMFWVFLLSVLLAKGAGPVSLDRLSGRIS